MRKTTLKQWIASYLEVNNEITYDVANKLYGCTYSGFTGRISELRAENWKISQNEGTYELKMQPDVDTNTVDLQAETDEVISLLKVAIESLENLFN